MPWKAPSSWLTTRGPARSFFVSTRRHTSYWRDWSSDVCSSDLPLEMQLLRIEPRPWSPVDSLALGKIIALGFSTNMETELLRADLVARVGAERAERLEPRYPRGEIGREARREGVEVSVMAVALK